MAKLLALGKKLASHPVAVTTGSFGLFISTFALVDYNREVKISDEIKSEFKLEESEHLGEALEQLHSKAFYERMTYENIMANSDRSIELFFLSKRAEQKVQEFATKSKFAKKTEAELEALVASEYQVFAQRMCRRSMIRNAHPVKWFEAVIQDEFVKVFLLPLAGFFAARYFKFFDSKYAPK